MFIIAYTLKGHVHVFAGQVKVVSAIFKYFCPLQGEVKMSKHFFLIVVMLHMKLRTTCLQVFYPCIQGWQQIALRIIMIIYLFSDCKQVEHSSDWSYDVFP